MLIPIFLIFLLCLLNLNEGQTTEFKITRVVEVGKASWTPLRKPIKWSPDSNHLAYFDNGNLIIADTLGHYNSVASLEARPWRHEWLSDKEVIVQTRNYMYPPSDFNQLFKIDISTGKKILLDEHTREKHGYRNSRHFEKLSLTLEGNVCFELYEDNTKSIQFPKSSYLDNNERINPEKNHVIRWGKDGLIKINTALNKKGEIIVENPQSSMTTHPIMSSNGEYLLSGSYLIRISDGFTIRLDTIMNEIPQGMIGCDFITGDINQHFTEILCDINCSDVNENELDMIASYDYSTNEFIVLDTLLGIKNCHDPVYSPDGLKIAFMSNKKAYIILREG